MSAPLRPDPEDGIPSYLNRLTQAPLLSQEEELRLTRAVLAGDPDAKRRLIESNMRLVINIAKGYRSRAIPLEDLIQEGAIGLMQAAERFDPEKGFRFSTYATHWIRQAIGRAIDNKSKAIRLPAHVSQALRKIEKQKALLTRDLGREPTLEELAERVDVPSKKLAQLYQAAQELLSLDMTVGDSGGMTLGGLIKDPGLSDPESAMIGRELNDELNRILGELNEREEKVMRLRFQLDADGYTESGLQDEIAKEMKLSRERVRQIEVQAIKKLRALAQRRRLKDMLSD